MDFSGFNNMTKNPFINSLSATAYIVTIASFMFFGKGLFPAKDNIFMPITMLSLLVLSVSVMSYFFFFQPIQLYLDGEKKQAANLFLKTVAVFAGTTVLALLSSIFYR